MNVVATFRAGKLKLVDLEGVATGQALDIRPDEGFVWEVLAAWGWHDDAAAKNLAWQFHDGTDTIETPSSNNTAANAKLYLYVDQAAQDAPSFYQVQISNRVYMRFTANVVLAAGKKLYFQALVMETAE